MARFPYTAELVPFQQADDAWGEELRKTFGKYAAQARYEPRGCGEEGTALRAAYEKRAFARIAWFRSADPVGRKCFQDK